MRLIIAAFAAVILSSSALAHAILVESTPAANAVVTGSSVALTLRYNSRIDKARSQLMLLRPDKSETKLAIAEDGPEDILTTTVALAPGAYRVRWQVLAIDGHITRGDLPFTVAAE